MVRPSGRALSVIWFIRVIFLSFFAAVAMGLLACDKDDCIPSVVYYSDFGAVGDGVTDDFCAIIATHEYANEYGVKVVADSGAKYYIGAHDASAVIKTDTDFGDAEFIIDDSGVGVDGRSWQIFDVCSDYSPSTVNIPQGYSLKKGQSNIGLTFDAPFMLYIVNSNKKDYIRSGLNVNSGDDRQECILVDKNGNVDKSTPILWDYDEVTSITAISCFDKPLTICGGTFTTIANTSPAGYYYERGINVNRSNTTLLGVKHYITDEPEQSSPYTGFFVVNYANHVTIKDCVMTGHKTYDKILDSGDSVPMGSYDTQARRSNDVSWVNCVQSNDITDTDYWGIMASNYCKNLKMQDCSLSRFDAHRGVYNATVTNTVLGQNLTIVGAGALMLENVTRLQGSCFMQLRTDYGSTWEGDIVIKNCVYETYHWEHFIIYASWQDWNFGYACYMPRNVEIHNFKVRHKGQGRCVTYLFSKIASVALEDIMGSSNPYCITERAVISGENTEIAISPNTTGLFEDTVVERV